jgi:hypothetical protein
MAKGQKTGGRTAGTPNKATGEVKALAGQYGPDEVKALAALAGMNKDEAGKAESEAARVAAIKELLDRAYGKAAQPVGGGDGTEAIKHLFGWSQSAE